MLLPLLLPPALLLLHWYPGLLGCSVKVQLQLLLLVVVRQPLVLPLRMMVQLAVQQQV